MQHTCTHSFCQAKHKILENINRLLSFCRSGRSPCNLHFSEATPNYNLSKRMTGAPWASNCQKTAELRSLSPRIYSCCASLLLLWSTWAPGMEASYPTTYFPNLPAASRIHGKLKPNVVPAKVGIGEATYRIEISTLGRIRMGR